MQFSNTQIIIDCYNRYQIEKGCSATKTKVAANQCWKIHIKIHLLNWRNTLYCESPCEHKSQYHLVQRMPAKQHLRLKFISAAAFSSCALMIISVNYLHAEPRAQIGWFICVGAAERVMHLLALGPFEFIRVVGLSIRPGPQSSPTDQLSVIIPQILPLRDFRPR